MPKKIYPNEMREWLEQYDSGQSQAEIAKSAHRDVRTVKKRIGQARREREAFGARVELLKHALKQHQDRLLNTLKELEAALVLPSRDLWRAWKKGAPMSRLGFIGATVTNETGKGWTVALAVQSKLEWGLLQEHLKGDPMWASLNAWRRAFEAYVEARVNLETKCALLLMKNTGYKLVEQSFDQSVLPCLYSYPILDVFYQVVLDKTLGVERETRFEDTVMVDKESGRVRYGVGMVLAEAPGEEEECKANILVSLKEVLESAEAAKVKKTDADLVEATVKAKRAVEEVLLLELVTGECRVCRRLGV